MTRVILTGGGTAGHVTPHLALLPNFQKLGWETYYIGTRDGIEREIIEGLMPYYSISAGKLRRYFDTKNFTDPFRILKGLWQSLFILKKIKPHIVFSKGGFVSVPVAVAAKMLNIPVILHESDITPGLANKLVLPFASYLCVTFPETLKFVPSNKVTLTGTPIRKDLFNGDKNEGYRLCGFNNAKPVIMVMGGSLGAQKINRAIRSALKELTPKYQIIHICGKGNVEQKFNSMPGYCQFEYVKEELAHLFAAADFVISRAGANALFELVALQKPHLLIPLSRNASRGDQILNARSFAKQGFSYVLEEEEMNIGSLLNKIEKLRSHSDELINNMRSSTYMESNKLILGVIESYKK